MEMIDMGWIEQVRLKAGSGHMRCNTGDVPGLIGRGAAQSTVEYALVGALVVIAAATALTMLGGELTSVFTHIANTLGAASAGH
jgi:Flp pilus assembly pilin Flp